MGVDGGGWNHPVACAVVFDLPMVVVHQHVVMPAEKHAAIEIRRPIIAFPMIDVVGFAPTGRPIASRHSAAAVSCGEHDALSGRKESLLSTEIETVCGGVEGD